jgi:hypothetical protein
MYNIWHSITRNVIIILFASAKSSLLNLKLLTIVMQILTTQQI